MTIQHRSQTISTVSLQRYPKSWPKKEGKIRNLQYSKYFKNLRFDVSVLNDMKRRNEQAKRRSMTAILPNINYPRLTLRYMNQSRALFKAMKV